MSRLFSLFPFFPLQLLSPSNRHTLAGRSRSKAEQFSLHCFGTAISVTVVAWLQASATIRMLAVVRLAMEGQALASRVIPSFSSGYRATSWSRFLSISRLGMNQRIQTILGVRYQLANVIGTRIARAQWAWGQS